MKPRKHKPYDQMNAAELAEATKEYDAPFAADRQARPLTPAQRAMYRRAALQSAAIRSSATQSCGAQPAMNYPLS